MYVLVETDVTSKTSNSHTFSGLEELAAWVKEKVPSENVQLSDVLRRSRELTTLLESMIGNAPSADVGTSIASLEASDVIPPVPTVAVTPWEKTKAPKRKPFSLLETPIHSLISVLANAAKPTAVAKEEPALKVEEEEVDSDDEDKTVDTAAATTGKSKPVHFERPVLHPKDFLLPPTIAHKSGDMTVIHPPPEDLSANIVFFGESMESWMAYNDVVPVGSNGDHTWLALNQLKAEFLKTWCVEPVRNPRTKAEFGAIGTLWTPGTIPGVNPGTLNVYDILVSSPSLHKFLWVLALNFPKVIFPNPGTFNPEAAVDVLGKSGHNGHKGHNLRTFYQYHTSELDQTVDVHKCHHLVAVLDKLKAKLGGFTPNLNRADDNTWERFLFRVLFHYYKEGGMNKAIVFEWVAAFMLLKTKGETDSYVMSSELYDKFLEFMGYVLEVPAQLKKKYESERTVFQKEIPYNTFPFHCGTFLGEFTAFINPKMFSQGVKKYGTSSVRRAAGVFYKDLALGAGSYPIRNSIEGYNQYDNKCADALAEVTMNGEVKSMPATAAQATALLFPVSTK
jgi:hypothetical protein